MLRSLQLTILFWLLIGSTLAPAQWTKTMGQRGFTPGAPFDFKGLDSVNLANRSLNVTIPITSMAPGKGGMSMDFNLVYNSSSLEQTWATVGSPWVAAERLAWLSGWNLVAGGYSLNVQERSHDEELGSTGRVVYSGCSAPANQATPPVTTLAPAAGVSRFLTRIVTPDGAPHVLYLVGGANEDWTVDSGDGWNSYDPAGTPSTCISPYAPWLTGQLTYATKDGTYMRLVTEGGHAAVGQVGQSGYVPASNWSNIGWTLYLADGTQVIGSGQGTEYILDRNGNRIDITMGTGSCFTPLPGTGTDYIVIRDAAAGVGAENRCVQIENPLNPTDSLATIVRQRGSLGQELTWTITKAVVTVDVNYNCIGQLLSPPGEVGPTTCPLMDTSDHLAISVGGLSLPGLNCSSSQCSQYAFAYQNWGLLSDITLPTGGTLHYEYESVPAGPGDANVNQFALTDRMLRLQDPETGVLCPSSESYSICETSTYQIQTNGAQEIFGVVTTTGRGTVKHYFHPTLSHGQLGGRVYKVERPDNSSVETFWTLNNAQMYNSGNPYVRRQVRNEVNAAGVLTLSAVTDTKIDINGNTLQQDEYDWTAYANVPHLAAPAPNLGSLAVPSVLKRSTINTYLVSVPESVYPPPSGNLPPAHAQVYWQATESLLRSPASSKVQNGSGTPEKYSRFLYDSFGNLTEERNWDNTKGIFSADLTCTPTCVNAVRTTRAYNAGGDLDKVTDANGNITKYLYSSSTDPYPTGLDEGYDTGLVRHWQFEWDPYTGQRKKETDVDNSVATSVTYDVRGRVTELKEGVVGTAARRTTATAYNDESRTVTVTAPLDDPGIASDCPGTCRQISTETTFDQIGRKWKTTQSPAGTTVKEFTVFQGMNTYQIVSNPFRTGAAALPQTEGWTRTLFNPSGRLAEVVYLTGSARPYPLEPSDLPNTGATQHSYDASVGVGAKERITDPAGKYRDVFTDGLGRLVQVTEAGTDITTYGYDATDHLKTVAQGSGSSGRPRTFEYTSLGRLWTATNPESGLIQYTYDNNGNLKTRTDARSVVTTTNYDALNRPTDRTYTDGTPAVTYSYGTSPAALCGVASKGRLCSVHTDGVGTNKYTYDALGRVTGSSQTSAGYATPFSFTYQYKLNNALSRIQYPSGKVVAYGFDDSGQVVRAAKGELTSSENYASSIEYAPHGGLKSWKAGASSNFAGIEERRLYNARLQPEQIQVAGGLLSLEFGYGGAANNGNVRVQEVHRNYSPTPKSWSYEYDGVNRLTQANSATSGWGQTFGYDRWGNRTITSGATGPDNPLGFQDSNRVSGWHYDLAGNLTGVPSGSSAGTTIRESCVGATVPAGLMIRTSCYDGENRQTSVTDVNGTVTTYVYDGEGRRIKKTNNGTTTTFVYDAMGQLAAEYGGPAPTATGTRYLFSDHLGSTRLIAKADGSVDQEMDYRPFGEEIGGASYPQGGGGHSVKFTAKERDAETGLDFFGARYYSSAQGRFTSPDAPFNDQHAEDPQSWNLYSYTRNNPLAHVDVDGEFVATVTGALAGGLIGGAVEAYRGGSFWKGAASGAVSGAIAGSIIDTGGASLGVLAAAGAAGGVGGGIVGRALDGQGTSVGDVARDASVGAVAGAVGGKLGEVVVNKVAGMVVQRAANAAVDAVGPGSGAAYGTRVHSAMEGALNKSGLAKALNLNTEVSYSGGQVVPRGTPGSVRVDVVRGNPSNPGAAFDLKTGSAKLTPGRTQQIQQAMPKPVPVKEIRPEVP